MRTLLLWCVVVVMSLGALGPGRAQAAGYSHFTSRLFHFSIDYPSTWQLRLDRKRHFEAFEFGQPGSVTVNYFPVSSGLDITTLTTRVADAYRASGFKPGRISYNHGEGTFTATASFGGLRLQTHMTTMVRTKGLYAIDLTAPESEIQAAVPVYRHMLKTFKSH